MTLTCPAQLLVPPSAHPTTLAFCLPVALAINAAKKSQVVDKIVIYRLVEVQEESGSQDSTGARTEGAQSKVVEHQLERSNKKKGGQQNRKGTSSPDTMPRFCRSQSKK